MAVEVGSSQSVAAWASTRGVFAAVAGSTGSFGNPERLGASGLPVDLAQPLLATDGRGDAIVIWERPYSRTITPTSSFTGSLYAAYRPAGGVFGAAELIARNARRAVVGMDGRGDATIAWAQSSGQRGVESIDVTERGSSEGPGAVRVLATGGVFLDGIAENHAGDAVVVWGSTAGIEAATREGDGQFGSPVPIVSAAAAATSGSVGIDAAGRVLVAWQGSSSRSVRVTALQIGAAVAGPVQTLRPAAPGWVDGPPLIDVDAAGDAIVVWQNTADTGTVEKLVAARSAAGRPFGTGVTIATDSGNSFYPVVAIGPRGQAIVAWESSTARVQAALAYNTRSPFGHAVAVAPAGEDSAAAAVGIGTHAHAITIWMDLRKDRLQYATVR
jgi:hypothetical protein